MSDVLLEMLRCPKSRQRLLPVTKKWIAAVNRRIEAGELRTESGQTVDVAIEDGFVTEDDQYLYPIRDRLPNLFIADRIVLAP